MDFFQFLEGVSRKEKIIQKKVFSLDGRGTCSLSVELEKGIEYSVIANSKSRVRCSVPNGDPAKPMAKDEGRKKAVLRIRPDQNGIYTIHVEKDPDDDTEDSEVTIMVKKEYIPGRVLARSEGILPLS